MELDALLLKLLEEEPPDRDELAAGLWGLAAGLFKAVEVLVWSLVDGRVFEVVIDVDWLLDV